MADTDPAIAEATRWLLEQQTLVRAPKREPLPTPIAGGGGAPTIVVAAVDSSAASKRKADLFCTGVDDQVIFRKASAMAEQWGRILLCEGSYSANFDGTRVWEHPGLIQGLGQRSTTIDIAGGSATDDFIYLGNDCELRDLFIRGSGSGRLVRMAGDGIRIDKVKVDGEETGIHVAAGSSDSWITDSDVLSNNGAAVVLASGNLVHIVGCRLDGATYGINDTGFSGSLWIEGNTINGDATAAVRLGSADNVILAGNVLFSLLDTIVGVNNTRIVIRGNIILGDDNRAIDLTTAVNPVIEGNLITQHDGAAIFLTGCTRPTVQNNHLFDVNRNANDVAAIVIDGTSSAVPTRGGSCKGNDVDATSATGIRILDGYSNFVIDDNKLTRIREHGIWATDLKYSQIHDNHVAWLDNMATNNTFDGIILDGDSDLNSLQDNTVRAEDTSAGTPGTRYGMNIAASTCNSNLWKDNWVYLVSDIQSAAYNDAGTATQGTNFSA